MSSYITTYRITYKCVKRYSDRSVVEFQVRSCSFVTQIDELNILLQWSGLMFHKPIIAGLQSLGIHAFATHSNRYTVIIPRNTDEQALNSHEFEANLFSSTTHIIYHMLPPPGSSSEEVMEVSLVLKQMIGH